MKIIHCADLHLDSAMTAHFDPGMARTRRGEILRTFERMVSYACDEKVSAILIAGDMFDSHFVSDLTKKTVLHCIRSNPGIAFFYLRGNHDEACVNLFAGSEELPANLILFGSEWNCYECGDIAIYGAETDKTDAGFYEGLSPEPDKINIVMLHGDLSEYPEGTDHGIDAGRLRGRNIDYLALGHIHSYSEGRLDERGVYCYPGCLEGRGFDECGKKGFALLDIDESCRKVSFSFVPFAAREIFSVESDVTGCMTTSGMISKSAEALADAGCCETSVVRLVLKGELDAECEKDVSYISTVFSEKYYFFRIVDETRIAVHAEDYMLDESLKGEFVRMVSADASLSDEDKAIIVRYGLRALAGEEAD